MNKEVLRDSLVPSTAGLCFVYVVVLFVLDRPNPDQIFYIFLTIHVLYLIDIDLPSPATFTSQQSLNVTRSLFFAAFISSLLSYSRPRYKYPSSASTMLSFFASLLLSPLLSLPSPYLSQHLYTSKTHIFYLVSHCPKDIESTTKNLKVRFDLQV